ncbi:MAG: hypothetical protein LBP89_04305 [Helicobacteraceae bacterium]|jgi:hypothetical protein|nr:hypothetical protein [Helicobacteraceae bacterium]
MAKQAFFAITIVISLFALWFIIVSNKEKESVFTAQNVLVGSPPSTTFKADLEPLIANISKQSGVYMDAPIVKTMSIRAKNAYQPNSVASHNAKDISAILLRCIFENEEHFNLVVFPSVIIEPEKYQLIINSDRGIYQIELDFLYSLEVGRSYDLFFNKDPFSIGGIRAFDYAVQSNDAIQKAMLEPPHLTPSVTRPILYGKE